MKTKLLIKLLFTLIVLLFLTSGCSSHKEVTKKKNSFGNETITDTKNAALEHFVNGSVAESKGNYNEAIMEFQQALSYDSSSGIYYALAKNYLLLGKIPQSLKYAVNSVKLDQSNVDYLKLLADIYSTAMQLDSSASVLSKVIQIDSSRIDAYYQLARLYENGKPLKAIEIYEKLLAKIGPEWNVLLRVSELYEQLGEYSSAVNSVNALLQIDPSNIAIKKLKCDLNIKNGNYDEALTTLDDILESTPDDLDARERKANLLLKNNDWQTAAKEFSYILNQSGIDLDIKIRVGAAYFEKSLDDSTLLPVAKEFFTQIDQDTLNWHVKLYLGTISLMQKDEDSFQINMNYAVENSIFNSQPWIRLGGLLFDKGKYQISELLMNSAIKKFPEDFAVNLILGLSYAQRSKHSIAEPYLKKSVELSPSDITALSAYGFTLHQIKRDDEAIEYLKRALIIDKSNVNLIGTLALIYDGKKDFQLSDSLYEKALTLDSVNALINNNFAYSLSERDLQLERALRMAEIAITVEPKNSSYLDTIGWVYFKLGNYNQAQNYLEKAIEYGGERSVYFDHLGDVMFMKGDIQKALEHWKKALKLDPINKLISEKIEKGGI
jgi:tetratricopeptide (TPR) repeat protein